MQDGVNGIYFEDPNDELPGTFDCLQGGTLGVGGAISQTPSMAFRGSQWDPIIEGNVVIQDGLNCTFMISANFAELYTHEVGHALGMGHPCGDQASGTCIIGSEFDEAVMRADSHGDGRGAMIRSDDVKGIQFLYCPTSPCTGCVPAANPCGTRVCGTVSDTCGTDVNCGTCSNPGDVCNYLTGSCCTPNQNPCGTQQCGIVDNGCTSYAKCGIYQGACPVNYNCTNGSCGINFGNSMKQPNLIIFVFIAAMLVVVASLL